MTAYASHSEGKSVDCTMSTISLEKLMSVDTAAGAGVDVEVAAIVVGVGASVPCVLVERSRTPMATGPVLSDPFRTCTVGLTIGLTSSSPATKNRHDLLRKLEMI